MLTQMENQQQLKVEIMKKHNSHILAVTSNAATAAGNFGANSFVQFSETLEQLPFHENNIWVGPREHLEMMPSFKQLIPYVVVMRDEKILVYKRTKKGGESRLHDQLSIGFGGHIDIGDIADKNDGQTIDLEATMGNAVTREISEELDLDMSGFEAYGMILDESNDVGKVHLGIVMFVKANGMVLSKEDQIELVGFKTIDEIMQDVETYENWSKIIVTHLSKMEGVACQA